MPQPRSGDFQLRALPAIATRIGRFTVFVDANRLLAYLRCDMLSATPTAEDVEEILAKTGIVFGWVEGVKETLLAALQKGPSEEKILLARGEPPQEGEDARIEFDRYPTGERRIDASQEGKVDYREVRSFENVMPGDRIAVYIPPVEGRGGTDVFGKIIPCRKTNDLNLKAGANVEYQEATRSFFATHYGHVVYEHGVLSVDPVYRVKGNLDLSHGNIRFVGRAEIQGDVPDEFVVEAKEGITIGGAVEAATLRSDGDIVIKGGVAGKGKGTIETKGSVQAHFLNEALVIAGGDVVVSKEIVNSKVYTLGRLLSEKGTLLGGEVVALRGILVQDVGSDLGVKTQVVAGIDYKVRERILEINQQLSQKRTRLQEMLDRIGPKLDRALRGIPLPPTAGEEIDEGMTIIRRLHREIQELEEENTRLSLSFLEEAIPCVSIAGTVYPGVTVSVGQAMRTVDKPLRGPMSIHQEAEGKKIAVTRDLLVKTLWEEKRGPAGEKSS